MTPRSADRPSCVFPRCAGETHEQVLADYPDLEEDILAALAFAAEAVRERELPLVNG